MPKICVRHSFWHLALFAAIAVAIPAAYAAPQDSPAVDSAGNTACASLGVYIFVGGTGGFDGLENGDQFTELLQTGHVGLYEHNNAIVAAEHPPSILQAIESVFTGTGPGQAELGQVGANYFTLPPSYGYYQAVYIQNGLHPTEANVNTPSDSVPPKQLQKALKLWREYVDAARTAGIETVAPVAGPNGRNEPKLGDHVFAANPYYALERGEALYGRAIAFDVPPNFFLTGGSGPGYQKFIVQAIQWGNEHGLRTTMLLSPFPWPTNAKGKLDYFRQFTTNTFSADTQAFVSYLSQQQAIPSEWSVDNYEDTYPHDTPAVVPETVENTTTAVGLWVAANAPVYVNGPHNRGVICGPPASSDGSQR
ncbi:MAG: hypothetical protein ABSC07_02565 [Terriglobales bacterium]|jgi:hypothetical protein